MAAVSYYYYITRLLGSGWTDLDQTSHMNRTSLKGLHSTFEMFKMATISKWPPFLTFTKLHDYSELDRPNLIKLHISIEHHLEGCIQHLKFSKWLPFQNGRCFLLYIYCTITRNWIDRSQSNFTHQ